MLTKTRRTSFSYSELLSYSSIISWFPEIISMLLSLNWGHCEQRSGEEELLNFIVHKREKKIPLALPSQTTLLLYAFLRSLIASKASSKRACSSNSLLACWPFLWIRFFSTDLWALIYMLAWNTCSGKSSSTGQVSIKRYNNSVMFCIFTVQFLPKKIPSQEWAWSWEALSTHSSHESYVHRVKRHFIQSS